MYESHFGFTGSPFQLNPDPAFYFESRGHGNALAYLKFGAHQGEGFIVVTGEIGAGKTTLVRTLLEGLDPNHVVAAQVVSTQLESGELLQAILMSFGVASSSNSKAHLIGSLEAFLTALAAKGRRALLIIDEAQNLKHEAVEELRMLSNFQLGKYGLLQSFLVGQPELRLLLQSKSMEQLRQRVIASCHLGPLAAPETRAYVEHRLRVVGWNNRPAFVLDAFERIHFWTGGVPRKINRLCNRLLLGAFLSNEDKISARMVDRTASELKSEIGELTEIPTGHIDRARSDNVDGPAERPDVTDQVERRIVPARVSDAAQPAPHDLVAAIEPRTDKLISAGETASKASRKPVEGSERGVVVPAMARDERAEPAKLVSERTERSIPAADMTTIKNSVPAVEVAPGSATKHTDANKTASSRPTRRIYRSGELRRPLICLVASTSDFLKAGTLAEIFLKFPALPRLMTVHLGQESNLSFGDMDSKGLPMPFLGLHIGELAGSFGLKTRQVMEIFEDILIEFDPQAILAMGNCDAVLACSLLAKKQGRPLFRIAGGQRDSKASDENAINGALIDKISDMLYVNRMDNYYSLYQEGISSERVLCVGNLVGDMLKYALPHAADPDELFASADTRGVVSGKNLGLVLIGVEPTKRFFEVGTLDKVVSIIIELAKDLSVAWPVEVEAMNYLNSGGYTNRLEASGVQCILAPGYLERLGLLDKAKCLIEFGDCGFREEAASLHIPTVRISQDSAGSELGLADAAETGDHGTMPILKTISALIEKPASAPDSPAYWDLGAATRIANHLGLWLPKTESANQALS